MGKGRAKGKKQQRKNAAPASGGAFAAGQRIKVTRPGSWACGCAGAVVSHDERMGEFVVQLDHKGITHRFPAADLAAE